MDGRRKKEITNGYIILAIKPEEKRGRRLDSGVSGQVRVVGFCECTTELTRSIKDG
jgi:hypothetical protein